MADVGGRVQQLLDVVDDAVQLEISGHHVLTGPVDRTHFLLSPGLLVSTYSPSEQRQPLQNLCEQVFCDLQTKLRLKSETC